MIYYFYKIVCDDLPNFVYVGSTMAYTNRKYAHKSDCNNENGKNYNYKIYRTIRDNGGWDNWRMVCIHQQDVNNKREAEQIEEDYRVELNGNMNTRRAFRSEEDAKEHNKEYRETNKEQISEKKKEYRETNKEQILEKKKEYYEKNKEHHAEQMKEYREQNKVKISEQKKEYYEQNKVKISEQKKEKITCDCGCEIRRHMLQRHKRTNKHIKLMGL